MVKQNRSIDPAAAAMSAIEAALNLGKEAQMTPESGPDQPASEPTAPRLPDVESHAGFAGLERPPAPNTLAASSSEISKPRTSFQPIIDADGTARGPLNAPQPAASPRAVAPSTPPANDDRRNVGQILKAMNVRTSQAPIWWAVGAALLWAALIGYYASTKWQAVQDGATPQAALLAAVLIGPILFFFVSAALLRRTQEMRLTARSMTEVAMRLAEPETLATEQVMTLSQAIRREVASMGDGIERALARASELETLVHSEVSNLERSYSDNERRIRSLIDLLSNEREAILTNSDQMRTAINGAQASLSQDLAAASGRIASDVETAGTRVTHSLGAKGEEISLALAGTGDRVVQQISARGEDIVGRLSKTGQDVDAHLTAASNMVATALAERVNEIDDRLSTTGKALIVDLSLRGNEVVDRLDQTSERIAATISASGDGLVARLAETGDRMYETVHVHGNQLHSNLHASSERLAQILDEHSLAASAQLTGAADTLTTRIDTQHNLFATRLQQIGDTIFNTIGDHSDSLVNRLSDGQLRLHETIMVHGSALDESLATTGANLAAIIGERASQTQSLFSEAGATLTSQLDVHRADISEKLSAHAATLSDNFSSTSALAVGAISEQATTLHSHFASKADQIAIKADQTIADLGLLTHELGAKMDQVTQAHSAALQTQHDAFQNQFAATSDANLQRFVQISGDTHTQFAAIADGARGGITSQTQYLTGHFTRTASEAVNAIGMHGDRINQTLADRLNRFEQTIGAEGVGVEQRIDAQTDRLTNAIDLRLTRLETSITERGDQLDNKLADRARHTAEDLDHRVSAFEERSSHKTNEIAASFDALISRVDTGLETRARALNEVLAHRALEVARVLGEGGREVTRALDAKAIEIDHILLSRSEALSHTLSSKADEINTTLGGRATEIAATLDNRIAQFEERVVGRLDEVSDTIDSRGNALTGALAARSNEINNLFTTHAGNFRSNMDQHAQDMATRLQSHATAAQSLLDTTSQSLAVKSDEFGALLGGHAANLQSTLDANSEKLRVVLNSAQNIQTDGVMNATHALTDASTNLKAMLDSHATHVVSSLDQHGAKLNDALGNTKGTAAAAIDAATQALMQETNRIDSIFERHTGAFHQTLQNRTQLLHDTMQSSTEQSQAILDTATRTLDTTLGNRARDLGATLVARLNEIDATMTTRLGTIHAALGERGRELNDTLTGRTQDLETLFDTRGDTLITLLSERGNEIARELASVGEMVSHAIDNRGTSIVHQLSQKQVELTGAIDQSTHALKEAMDGGANQSVLSLANLSDQLKGELVQVIDRLEATNNSLGTLVSNAGYNLSSIEGALTGRMKDFSQALGAVTSHVAALNETATSTLQDGHALASRIDGHAKALNLSAAALAQIQIGVDATLESRRNSLEALLANVNSKTADFESMTRSFGQLVDEAFLSAEARARDIGNFLAQSTQETAGMIGAQYADVRSLNEAERQKIATQMRSASEQAKAEIGDVLATSLERFKATVGEMRGMSGQIQHELELTRHELARGIGEIPADTAEQASAMRRVVAEQIKALNELTDIVVKSGRAHDLATPEAVSSEATPQDAMRALTDARLANVGPAQRKAEPPFVFPGATTSSAPRPTPSQAMGERGPGWISDLLARASTDAKASDPKNLSAKAVGLRPTLSPKEALAATKPSATTQPLETLSVDIARMVDEAALADNWDRYRRGEKAAFNRSIYTKQGQQAFEEIRRRYTSDSNFRGTVDRYIQEFERILSDINADDGTGIKTRDYLISDTGKIYTMLAQAAGRLV